MKYLFLLLSFYCLNAFADIVKNPHIFIFHVNGVNTTRDRADENRFALQSSVKINSNIVTWDVIYNSTHGFLASDLWDVMRMKKQEHKNLSIDDYVKTYMKTYHLHYPVGSPEYAKLKENIKQYYINDPSITGKNLAEIINQFHQKVPPPYASVVELLNQHKDSNGYNAYVLLIPHSQGNQYANQLWKYVTEYENFPKSHLAVFGIASPTDRMQGTVIPSNQDSYYTSDNDFVINSLSALSMLMPQTNKPLSGNLHLYNCKDLLCHNLIDSYLRDEEAKYRISNRISSFIISLKKNMIEEQLGKNIKILFWMNEQFSYLATLRSGMGKVICSNAKCDENITGYIKTSIPQNDPYDGYRWSLQGFNDGPYVLLVSPHYFSKNIDDYFFIRGNISIATDYTIEYCDFYQRDRRALENNRQSPFFGKPYAGISTHINNGCPLPLEMLYDNGTKILLGSFLL